MGGKFTRATATIRGYELEKGMHRHIRAHSLLTGTWAEFQLPTSHCSQEPMCSRQPAQPCEAALVQVEIITGRKKESRARALGKHRGVRSPVKDVDIKPG